MTVPAHLQYALSCQNLYSLPSTDPTRHKIGALVFKIYDGNKVVARGSAKQIDWMHDFNAFPIRTPALGTVDHGFYINVYPVFQYLASLNIKDLTFIGHSLGGAHATILAALFTANNLPWSELVTFGAPRPGYSKIKSLLSKDPSKSTAYRNNSDIVPTLPCKIGPFMYQDAIPHTQIGPDPDSTNIIRSHLIGSYISSLPAHLNYPPQGA